MFVYSGFYTGRVNRYHQARTQGFYFTLHNSLAPVVSITIDVTSFKEQILSANI